MHQEPDVGFDPGSPGLCPGPKAGAKPLCHPGIPMFSDIMDSYIKVSHLVRCGHKMGISIMFGPLGPQDWLSFCIYTFSRYATMWKSLESSGLLNKQR